MADQAKKDKADVAFRKVQQAEDGKRAMSEYESAIAATRVKTARLRALRMARDAAAAAAPAPLAKKKPAKKAKPTAVVVDGPAEQKGSDQAS